METVRHFFFFAMFCVLTTAGAAFGGPYKVMTEANAPFNFEENGTIKGITTEVLLEAARAANVDITPGDIKVIPWARAYQVVQEDSSAILYSMARTAQREEMFQWVGPVYDLKIGLIAPKGKKISLASPAEATKYRVGTVRDGAPEQLLVKAGADVQKMDRTSSLETNIKKLKAGRIDILAFNVPAAMYMMQQMGMDLSEYEVITTLKEVKLHIAFNKDFDKKVVDDLQAAFDKLRASGKLDSVITSYF